MDRVTRPQASPATSMKLAANSSHDSALLDVAAVESHSISTYHPPLTAPPAKTINWVHNPNDGSVLLDHKGQPLSVDKLLATKPLRGELSTRPGPGGKKLTYISGEGVTRTLNDIFGYDGWNLDISRVQREECLKDDKTGKYTVVYTALVRLTHKASGSYREDCGAGDSTDRCFGTAVSHAIKASITDAMKRAARHFGDKLGNSLYQGNFSVNKAPVSLKDALDKYDIERANTKFGFPKDQLKQTPKQVAPKPNSQVQPAVAQARGTMAAVPKTTPPPPPMAPSLPANPTRSTLPTTTASPKPPKQANPTPGALHHNSVSHTPHPQQQGPHRRQDHSVNHAAATPSTVLPPPTPMDALRNSALFGGGQILPSPDDAAPRPTSSHGRMRGHTNQHTVPGPMATALNPVGTSANMQQIGGRRVSMGDNLPSQGDQNRHPNQQSAQSDSNSAKAYSSKREATNSVHAIDTSQTKRMTVNPYTGART